MIKSYNILVRTAAVCRLIEIHLYVATCSCYKYIIHCAVFVPDAKIYFARLPGLLSLVQRNINCDSDSSCEVWNILVCTSHDFLGLYTWSISMYIDLTKPVIPFRITDSILTVLGAAVCNLAG